MNRKDLEDAIWAATCMCLKLNPDIEDETSSRRVRISWPDDDAGNSDWKRDENIVFLRISPGTDRYGDLHDVGHIYDEQADELKEIVNYHRCHLINWVCYGPDSEEDADTIRIGILRNAVRSYLKKQQIAIIPHIKEPVRIPEQDDTGDWWERYDLTCECYELVTREYDVDFIEQVPNINVTF